MKKDIEKTIVIFRKWRGKNADVIALMPFVVAPYDANTVMCYEHTDQHGAGNDQQIVSQSRLATPDEYASLLKELEDLGYNVETRKRIPANAYHSRKREIAQQKVN